MSLTIKEVFAKVGKNQIMGLVVDGSIFYIVLNKKMNMVDQKFIDEMNQILDKIEATHKADEPAVIVTIGSGSNVFCSGFDLKYWAANPVN